MKKNSIIRDAIDESLSGVRFGAEDARSVMRAVRTREPEPEHAAPPRRLRLDLAFACALLLILVVPVSYFALRAQSTRTANVVAGPGGTTAVPQLTVSPQEDRIVRPEATALTGEESEAIRIARACFEAQCDTDIFTFEEYTVSGSREGSLYTVDLTCIYGNGCRFTVVVDMARGEAVEYSTPELATVPTYLDRSAPEIRAWYEKNGPYLFTWPAGEQAEFSRRYEGGALRMPREGELSFEEAKALALVSASEMLGLEEPLTYAYPSLYAGNARTGEAACYVVYCTQLPVTDALPEDGLSVTVTFSATGEDVSLTVENGTALPD